MSIEQSNGRAILCFCHIVKAAGTTFTDILRKNNGIGHLNVEPLPGEETYSRQNMKRDISSLPWLRSLAGHSLRPYIDYGENNRRLRWITWLRDPVSRLISGYQHGVEKGGLTTPFEVWLTQPGHRNRQVYFLSGSADDLAGAKQILTERFVFTGFVEHFNESLIAFRQSSVGHQYDITYPKPSNRAVSGQVANNIRDQLHRYKALIEENTALDKELYDWALANLFNNRDKEIGTGDSRSLTDRKLEDSQLVLNAGHTLRDQVNLSANYLFRHVIYKPALSRLKR